MNVINQKSGRASPIAALPYQTSTVTRFAMMMLCI